LTWLRSRSYGLRVTLSSEGGVLLAHVDLTNVFIDPGTMRPVVPDQPVAAALQSRVAANKFS
jgi:acyl-CoA thioesterase FadM